MAGMSSDVRTFAVTFGEQEYDESPFSRWVSQRFATKHTEVRLGVPEFEHWLDDALAAFDVPSFDGINTYFVSRAAREAGLTVALSGVGGDELFGGYPFFGPALKLATLSRFLGVLPSASLRGLPRKLNGHVAQLMGVRKTLELLCAPRESALDHMLAGYQTTQVLFPSWSRERLIVEPAAAMRDWFGLSPEFKDFILDECGDGVSMDHLCKLMGRLFLGSRCLGDTDTMSMAVSLEVRAPFTDHLLVEKLLGVPAPVRCAGSPDKPFEWRLFKPLLGHDYPIRQKKGFVFPFNQWLRKEPVCSRILDTVQDPECASRCGLSVDAIQNLVQAFLKPQSKVPWSRIWSLYVLMDWCRRNGITSIS
jgi:asparagine synthase (glutamine-hydrolysing)